MKLRDLKTFLREHPEVIFVSLKGKFFPKWPWNSSALSNVRSMDVDIKNRKPATVFYHKENTA